MPALKTFDELLKIFLEANERFLSQNAELLITKVSERTLCGALIMAMSGVIRWRGRYFSCYQGKPDLLKE
ncbi:hypothetical protein AT727_08805 [Desulfitobacterium hafniense]|uniref:Uncharacterized protein n=1 Tax=Desulfitobacterium hafniense TaxID=49338 RepID=A0A0W1JDV1_DESHA|nr:hypothetical protein [Desulfitobacterium hafniense]KTE90017.1 hypothetical protein AT727_08805 [Desulfitobacterium hafniense]